MTVPHRILIVDDHPLVALGLQVELVARGWQVQTTSGPTAAAVIEHADDFRADCIVLDVNLGPEVGSGVDLIAALRERAASVVMLSGETDRLVVAACLEAGAVGWIAKSAGSSDIVASIEDVLAGRNLIGRTSRETLLDELRTHRAGLHHTLSPFEQLTACEQRVLGALIEGLSAEEIADTHILGLSTIRSQIRAVLRKLEVRSQLAAVAHANRAGWRPATPARRLVGA
jgi:DNA-binding NarL/FixJ family response regulator